jgi:hypothetical protein
MEHVMETSARWKLEAHSHRVDDLCHLVRPDEARLQFPAGAGAGQGSSCSLPKAEKRPVANLVVDRTMMLVVGALLDRLGLLKTEANVIKESRTLLHLLGDSSDTGLARFI